MWPEAGRRGEGGSGSRVRAAPGDGVRPAPPAALCSSGSADSVLTFLSPEAPAAFCSPASAAREATLIAGSSHRFFCFPWHAAGSPAFNESAAADRQAGAELGGGALGLPVAATTTTTRKADGGGA